MSDEADKVAKILDLATERSKQQRADRATDDTKRDLLDVITPIDWLALANTPPVPRRFVVPDWRRACHHGRS